MQDIAGARVVVEKGLVQQNEVVQSITELFTNSRIIDRRVLPTHGYRAVHVVVTVDDCPVEIQIRTLIQDAWAQFLEKIADAWGRDIRYGGAPIEPQAPIGRGTRQGLVEAAMRQSALFAEIEEFVARLHDQGLNTPALENEWNNLCLRAGAVLKDFTE